MIKPLKTLLLLTCMALLGCTSLWGATMEASVKTASGKAEYAAPGSNNFKALKAGQNLPIGSTIKTGTDGVVILLTVPGAAVRVGPDTQLILNELEFEKAANKVIKRKATIDLKTGTVSALIEKNTPDATDFRIKTPQGIAAARGTFYGVTVVDGKAHVAVEEGKVGIQLDKKAEPSK